MTTWTMGAFASTTSSRCASTRGRLEADRLERLDLLLDAREREVCLVHRVANLRRGSQHFDDRAPGRLLENRAGAVQHVGDGELETSRSLAERHDLEAAGDVLGKLGNRFRRRDRLAKVDHRKVQLVGEGLDQLALRDGPERDQLCAEPQPRDDLLGQRDVELLFRDRSVRDEHVPDAHRRPIGGRPRRRRYRRGSDVVHDGHRGCDGRGRRGRNGGRGESRCPVRGFDGLGRERRGWRARGRSRLERCDGRRRCSFGPQDRRGPFSRLRDRDDRFSRCAAATGTGEPGQRRATGTGGAGRGNRRAVTGTGAPGGGRNRERKSGRTGDGESRPRGDRGHGRCVLLALRETERTVIVGVRRRRCVLLALRELERAMSGGLRRHRCDGLDGWTRGRCWRGEVACWLLSRRWRGERGGCRLRARRGEGERDQRWIGARAGRAELHVARNDVNVSAPTQSHSCLLVNLSLRDDRRLRATLERFRPIRAAFMEAQVPAGRQDGRCGTTSGRCCSRGRSRRVDCVLCGRRDRSPAAGRGTRRSKPMRVRSADPGRRQRARRQLPHAQGEGPLLRCTDPCVVRAGRVIGVGLGVAIFLLLSS